MVVSHLLPQHRVHLLFGANTDVGKSIVSTGLVRAAAVASGKGVSSSSVNYIKPLQCGGSDESFVLSHHNNDNDKQHQKSIGNNNINCQTLFTWKTPASPHLVSRWENLPVSDEEVLSSLQSAMQDITSDTNDEECSKSSDEIMRSVTIIESAGGVLSPSSSSPLNRSTTDKYWGWSTQADLYASLNVPVVFVGDGKLGGISVTLASLEALWSRGYRVDAIVFIEGVDNVDGEDSNIQFGKSNTDALREYISMQQLLLKQKVPKTGLDDNEEKVSCLESLDHDSIICLPPLPPMPIPLDDWYESNQDTF